MDYRLIDADNHYYETEDCFTRHGDDQVKRFVRWVSEGKRRHLLFGDVRQTMVPNPRSTRSPSRGVPPAAASDLADGGGPGVPGHNRSVPLRRARTAAAPTTRTATRASR